MSEYYKQYYEKNKEIINKKHRDKYAPIKEANRIRREKERAEKQKYYEEHKEEIDAARKARNKELNAIWQKVNREELNAKRREYYRKNPETYKAAAKRWREKNKEKLREYNRKYYKKRKMEG